MVDIIYKELSFYIERYFPSFHGNYTSPDEKGEDIGKQNKERMEERIEEN